MAVEQALAVWSQAESAARQLRDQRATSAAQAYHSVLDRLHARASSAFQDYLNALANVGCGEGSSPRSTQSGNWDWLDYAANLAAGWGDTLSFNVTNIVRNAIGINDGIDHHSKTYSVGQWTGVAHMTAIGAVAGSRCRYKRRRTRVFALDSRQVGRSAHDFQRELCFTGQALLSRSFQVSCWMAGFGEKMESHTFADRPDSKCVQRHVTWRRCWSRQHTLK